MPPRLNFPAKEVDLWVALQLGQPTRRGPYFLTGIARLKPGISISQARANTPDMRSSFTNQRFDFNFVPINDYIVGDVSLAVVALLVAVNLVLLIAAFNVANLTLVRAAARIKEISVRAALGASRRRILGGLLAENLLLALAGGLVGLVAAVWGVGQLVKF